MAAEQPNTDQKRFQLDPTLEQDTVPFAESALCLVRLMNDQQYPWLVIIPKVANAVEITDLSEADYDQVWKEVRTLTQALHTATDAEKMNVATLGNVVKQLHIHVVARYTEDAAWPAPIWGRHPTIAYPDATETARTLGQLLGKTCAFHYAFSATV